MWQTIPVPLEKPVLFDVTELKLNTCSEESSRLLEKPVLFDVTERIKMFLITETYFKLEKPVLFDVTERSSSGEDFGAFRLEKPVLFDVTERDFMVLANGKKGVGKAGFIWCHGTNMQAAWIINQLVGKAGFIWCHGTKSQFLNPT